MTAMDEYIKQEAASEEQLKRYRELKKELTTIEGLKREVDYLRGVPRGSDRMSAHRARPVETEATAVETVYEVIERKRVELVHELVSIEEEIAQLTPLTRAVLRMHYIEGDPFWKIAQKLGYSERQIIRVRDRAIGKKKPHTG